MVPAACVGSGGMASKLAAAKIATWSGVQPSSPMLAGPAWWRRPWRPDPGVGHGVPGPGEPAPARKLWIAFALGSRAPDRR